MAVKRIFDHLITMIADKWHHQSVKKRRKTRWGQILFTITALVLFFTPNCSSFVIAPPWANPQVNRCSRTSWQLILWPKDEKCYQIFEQGPCPRTQELAFNPITKLAECRCPKNLLYWPATDRCYTEHGRGPCEINQYLIRDESSTSRNVAQCKNTKICGNGWIFWPPAQQCYQLYTQGPCHKVTNFSLKLFSKKQ